MPRCHTNPKDPVLILYAQALQRKATAICSAHKQSAPIDSRASSAKRGYDRHWQKLRVMHLRQHPLCEICKSAGVIREAELVHHLKSVNDRPDLRLHADNLVSLCRDCHAKVTAKERQNTKG